MVQIINNYTSTKKLCIGLHTIIYDIRIVDNVSYTLLCLFQLTIWRIICTKPRKILKYRLDTIIDFYIIHPPKTCIYTPKSIIKEFNISLELIQHPGIQYLWFVDVTPYLTMPINLKIEHESSCTTLSTNNNTGRN